MTDLGLRLFLASPDEPTVEANASTPDMLMAAVAVSAPIFFRASRREMF